MNPVLVNDLRKSLFRRKPVLAVAYMAAAILVLVFGVSTLMPAVGSWQVRQYPVWRFPDLLLPLVAPAFAAGAFAKEHEQRTWQDVLLTRLSGGEILWGKFFACFLPTLVALTVLFPPFLLVLILQNVEWAMDPGPWMLIWGAKLLISVSFYVSAALVCSYHSPNARVALVITYCVLVGYGLLNYAFWQYMIAPPMMSAFAPGPQSYNTFSLYMSDSDRQTFHLSPVDWLILLQSAFLGIGMVEAIELSGVEVVIEDKSRKNLIAVYPYRDSDESKVKENTKEVLLILCGVPGISLDQLEQAKSLAKDYVERFCK